MPDASNARGRYVPARGAAGPPPRDLVTLILEEIDTALAEAHRELYPERVHEQIPLSLTLLYPWIAAEAVTAADVDSLRSFFAARPPFAFDLVRVTEFPGIVAYAVPEPDEELREMMRALWAPYPQYPPYCEPGSDPPPHATLGRVEGDYAITLAQARERVEPLLPVRCEIHEAALMEEYELERYRVRDSFPLAA